VVGEQKGDAFDEIYIPHERVSFNASGTKVAFGARKGSEIWWKIMDVR
jgi:hypothetical protein